MGDAAPDAPCCRFALRTASGRNSLVATQSLDPDRDDAVAVCFTRDTIVAGTQSPPPPLPPLVLADRVP